MDRSLPSRRIVLRYGTVGLLAALAGCFGTGDDSSDDADSDASSDDANGDTSSDDANGDGDTSNGDPDDIASEFTLAGDGAEAFRGWVLPDTIAGGTERAELVCQYTDYEAAAEQSVASLEEARAFSAGDFGTQPEALSATLLVGDIETRGEIHFGTFDPEQVTAHLTAGDGIEETDEYEGYRVVTSQAGGGAAISTDEIVVTPRYEEYIDAAAGDGARFEDTGPFEAHASLLFDLLPAGVETAVSIHPNLEDLALNGEMRVSDEGETFDRGVRAFIFEDEADASIDRAREILDTGEYDEVLTEEQYDRAVMVEYTF